MAARVQQRARVRAACRTARPMHARAAHARARTRQHAQLRGHKAHLIHHALLEAGPQGSGAATLLHQLPTLLLLLLLQGCGRVRRPRC